MKRHLLYLVAIPMYVWKNWNNCRKKSTLPNKKNLADGGSKEGEEEEWWNPRQHSSEVTSIQSMESAPVLRQSAIRSTSDILSIILSSLLVQFSLLLCLFIVLRSAFLRFLLVFFALFSSQANSSSHVPNSVFAVVMKQRNAKGKVKLNSCVFLQYE